MDRIICVVGPTASGKTKLAVELAKKLDGEVLSCDSMQIYRGMNIGTAKPTADEMDGVRHHMLDVADPGEDFSVGRYVEQADACLRDILARGKTAVIAGGTGLYVDSLISGRTFAPCPSSAKRDELERRADAEGTQVLLEELRAVDPDAAARLHVRDRKRIIRALEVYLETGKTITQHNLETQQLPPRWQAVWLGMTFRDRADLYDRIDRRVLQMLQDGLAEEVRALLARDVPSASTALQAIGYKEMLAALRGEISMEQAVAQIQQASRNYAKRQLTWFRRNRQICWLEQTLPLDFSAVFAEALHHIPFFAPQ